MLVSLHGDVRTGMKFFDLNLVPREPKNCRLARNLALFRVLKYQTCNLQCSFEDFSALKAVEKLRMVLGGAPALVPKRLTAGFIEFYARFSGGKASRLWKSLAILIEDSSCAFLCSVCQALLAGNSAQAFHGFE